jgi:hypothetical protein
MLVFYPSRMPDPGVKKAPDPGVKKAPDPGSGSATLITKLNLFRQNESIYKLRDTYYIPVHDNQQYY